MGLFSSKKKITATTTVSPIMDKNQITNPAVNACTDYTLMGNPSWADSLMGQVNNTLFIKTRRGYQWAKDNDFTNGLPKSNLITASMAEGAVTTQLTTMYGAHTKLYYEFGPLNLTHYAWWKLVQSHGYNPATNILGSLTTSLGTTVYLKDIVLTLRQETYDAAVENDELAMYDVWDISPASGVTLTNPSGNPTAPVTPYVISGVAPDESITVYYEHMVGEVITTSTLTLSLSAVDEDADHHQALIVQTDGTRRYFNYLDGAGTYPAIDAVFGLLEDGGGSYLPWTYCIRNYANKGKPPSGPYDPATMSRKGKALPTDSKEYKDHIKWCNYLGLNYQSLCDSVQQNPEDLENTVQIAMMFGVETKGASAVEREYLFRYFSAMYDLASPGVQYGTVGSSSGARNMAQVIKDKYAEQVFSFSGIRRTLRTGVVAGLREYTRLGAGIWAHQINETEYVEVQAYKVNLRNKIQGKYGHDGKLDAATCRVPIDVAIMQSMSIIKKAELINHAAYLSINTYVEVETKWYQSGVFKIVLIVIAIICMFIPGLQPVGMALAMAAGATAVAIYLITTVLITLVIQYAITYLVDVLGIKNSFILAVIAIAATVFCAYSGIPMDQGTWGGVLQSAATNLVTATQAAQQEQMMDLQKDMAQFAMTAKEKKDALQEQIDKYQADFNYIDAMAYVRREPMIVFGENPQDFFERTVHTPNPGVACYAGVTNYITNKLKLPTIPTSLTLIAESQGTR